MDSEQQTDVRLVSTQSENGKYNAISVWFNKIWKKVAKSVGLQGHFITAP